MFVGLQIGSKLLFFLRRKMEYVDSSLTKMCQIQSGVISSFEQRDKHPLHAAAWRRVTWLTAGRIFFPASVFQNENTNLIYVPARLNAVNCLHIICFRPPRADCSPCWKCISYPKISIFRAGVAAINGLIFDHMNKERRTSGSICIHTCQKVCIYAVAKLHTLMRQLFRQQAESNKDDRTVRRRGISIVSWTSERMRAAGGERFGTV